MTAPAAVITSPSTSVPPAGPHTLLAGVDGGGTGTRVRLQDAAGRMLGTGSAGPSGLSQGVAQAWRHIRQALDAALAEAGLTRSLPADVALGLGLAGAEIAVLHAEFIAHNPGYALGVLVNDGLTQLAGVHAGRPGIVVSAGTGAVAAAAYADGRVRRSGGWGWPAGDEGAGSWLGLHAVRALQRALDGRAAATPLSSATARATAADLAGLIDWCAQAGQHAYAQLAPLVFDAAEQGDPAAILLLDQAAVELAALAVALSAEPGAADLPIVLNGSIGSRLAPRWPADLRARLVPPAGDSADGALLLLRRSLAV